MSDAKSSRVLRGKTSHLPTLKRDLAIFDEYKAGRRSTEIASRFDLSLARVGQIINRLEWLLEARGKTVSREHLLQRAKEADEAGKMRAQEKLELAEQKELQRKRKAEKHLASQAEKRIRDAAPDMLAALRDAEGCLEEVLEDDPEAITFARVLETVRAAIAKAEGAK